MTKPNMKQPLLGVDYYPEHWPEERWAVDARLMREAGLSVVRLAEFSWAKMEPSKGQYNWLWLDKAIETLVNEGLQIVLGTPTPAPPAWLIQSNPDILPVDAQGYTRNFGSRRHYCFNNPAYHDATRSIVTAMGERFGNNPAVIGWQLDNEFGCHDTVRCYCKNCIMAFRVWLRNKYGSLEMLNTAWGNIFWSQSYNDWAQIMPPNLTVTEANPSHVLDWYRFSSDSVAVYQQIQIDILRRICPDKFITTNFMGPFPDLNHYMMAAPLDFITWDNYPTGYAEHIGPTAYMPNQSQPDVAYDVGDPYLTGFCHDLMRGLKDGASFWVMEQQAGHINWGKFNPAVRPGTIRLWTWHNMAAGADVVVYFRWRACRFAQEQYHSGLLHHDGTPDMGYREMLGLKNEQTLMRSIQGTRVVAEAAILADYEDLWALDFQPHNHLITFWRHLFAYHCALIRAGVPTDIISTDADLSQYKLVIAPTLLLADDALATRLASYVQSGGMLLLGIRSGFKTLTNIVTDKPLPGPFRNLVGTTVEAWHSLPPGVTYTLMDYKSRTLEATIWAEGLVADSANPLISYNGGPLEGHAAVTVNSVGQGRAVYAGLWPNEAVLNSLISWLLPQAGIKPLAQVPEGVLVYRRKDSGCDYLFLLNFKDVPAIILLNIAGATDAITGQPVEPQVTIAARDLRLLKLEVT
jgi:beta-galactosidase